MKRMPKVLVLGGKGFIGRHVIDFLSRGGDVTIGTRQPDVNTRFPELGFVLHEMIEVSDWLEVVNEFDVVLNCVGILRQRWGETYEAVHHHAPAAIAAACSRAGTRYIHVSAIGLRADAKSRFSTSKLRGESAIEAAGGNSVIARVSLLEGEGGFGAAWLRGIARLPIFIVPGSATGLIAALNVDEAGEALANLCLNAGASDTTSVELGGEYGYSFEDYIRGLRRRHTRHRALAIRLPGNLMRLAAHLFDLLHFSPFSYGHWEMLCHDNIPRAPDLRKLLGRAPAKVIDR